MSLAPKEERSYGFVVVYRTSSASDLFLLVHQKAGNWSFPKGHPEAGETPLDTARRELLEECAIEMESIVPDISFTEEYEFLREGVPTKKTNVFFLGFVTDTNVISAMDEIQECRFAAYEDALGLLAFPENKKVLTEAQEVLSRMV